MRRAVDTTRLPPPAVPLAFLLAAPWFGVAAGVVVAWHGAAVFASRWSAPALAAVHLVTLGFLTMTMAGSLLQMVPAVAGLPLRGTYRVAAWSCPLLGAGAALLAAAFLSGHVLLFALAGAVLVAAFGVLLACLLPSMWAVAAAALLACVVAGLLLAGWLAGGPAVPVPPLVDTHAALGLAGWVVPLVMAVSFQVIPMFQATDPFPPLAARVLVPLVLLASAGWIAGRWLDSPWRTVPALAGAALVTAYAGLAASLLLRRKRTRTAAGTPYWLLSLAALAGTAWLFAWPGGASDALVGVCFLAGCAMSAVNGMLYRIVPFLVWHHLRARLPPHVPVPKFAELIAPSRLRTQCRWHAAAVAVLLAACAVPPLASAGGLLLALACLRLGLDLAAPVLRHRWAS
ncbi:hypothetical protein [Massilia sp. CT11-137]|uniref:hypothetical protein n=1 Tax=Massilia sp. CT11-137 TaxID=3393901 RepID=UPI0039AFF820